jgi:16S rRNA (cytidine1402-2'-O)-methyltransferase
MTDRKYTIGGAVFDAPALAPGLYPVATPIGNLRDITIRALETLAAADILACEDTRVTRVLLNRYGITRRPAAYHEHNAASAGPKLIAALKAGRSVAFCSDAGTPLVSDPGQRLVAAARDAGLPVFAVPGASAPLAALSVAGLATDSFFFAGFLPHKTGQRLSRLKELAAVPGTLVFFEAPTRIAATLAAMVEAYGGTRRAVVARELTKAHEESPAGTLAELALRFSGAAPRGEIVVLVAPPEAAAPDQPGEALDALLVALAGEMPAAKAAAEASRRTGRAKGELFDRINALKGAG